MHTTTAILREMTWLNRHSVLVAGLVAIAVVLVALTIAVLQAIRAWRRTKAALADGTRGAEVLKERVTNLEAQARDLQTRQGELSSAVSGLNWEAGVAKVIAAHAGRALAILKAPLRYVGR